MAQRGGATRKDADARKRAAPKREAGNSALTRAVAFGVHLLTASGAACALLAMMAAVRADWVAMFAWLGLALAIDGFDGTLARYFRVSDILPRWSGTRSIWSSISLPTSSCRPMPWSRAACCRTQWRWRSAPRS